MNMTPGERDAIQERAEARAAYSDERGETDFDHDEYTALADESAADIPKLLAEVDRLTLQRKDALDALKWQRPRRVRTDYGEGGGVRHRRRNNPGSPEYPHK